VTPPEHTPLDDLRDAVAELQRERQESRDHRTRVQTLLTLAGAAAIAVVLGAKCPYRVVTTAERVALQANQAQINNLPVGFTR
jgi:hypothetical protein